MLWGCVLGILPPFSVYLSYIAETEFDFLTSVSLTIKVMTPKQKDFLGDYLIDYVWLNIYETL